MKQPVVIAAALVAGVAVGAAGTAWWRGRSAQPWAPQVVSAVERPKPPPAATPEAAPPLPPPDALPPEAKTHPQYFSDQESQPEKAPVIPARVDFPRLGKLAGEPLSELPHEVIGAWDESPDSPDPGRRRAFVVVVDPATSDAQLAALARDIRRSEIDAPMLSVRIYDSEDDARVPGVTDGGARGFAHLVAEVKRNDAAGLDVIRVRGKKIEP
jgi:hypothetical protein